MEEQRIVILDGSRSLFQHSVSSQTTRREAVDEHLSLHPIPDFNEIVAEAAKDAFARNNVVPTGIILVDNGVICDTSSVKDLMKAIHARVLRKLHG